MQPPAGRSQQATEVSSANDSKSRLPTGQRSGSELETMVRTTEPDPTVADNIAVRGAALAGQKERERNNEATEQQKGKAGASDKTEVEHHVHPIQDRRARSTSMEQTIESLTGQLDVTNATLKARDTRIQDLQNKVLRRDSRIAELQHAFTQKDSAHQAEVEQVAKTIQAQTLAAHQQDLEHLHSQVSFLEKSLEDCKEQIFRLQPEEGFTDAKLADAFRQLFDSVENWLDDGFPDIAAYKGLVVASDSKDFSDMIHQYFIAPGVKTHAKRFPRCEHIWLRYLITQHLHWHFLDGPMVYPGNSENANEFLLSIETSMAGPQLAKDRDLIRKWRVETMRAMQYIPVIADAEERRVHLVGKQLEDLFTFLSRHFAHSNKPEAFDVSGLAQIVFEAVILSKNIKTSLAEYEILWQVFDADDQEICILSTTDLKRFTVVDAASGTTLRPLSKPIADNRGRVGTVLCVLQPALIKKKSGSVDHIMLVNATVLVAFDKPVPRAGKSKQVLSSKDSASHDSLMDLDEGCDGGVEVSGGTLGNAGITKKVDDSAWKAQEQVHDR